MFKLITNYIQSKFKILYTKMNHFDFLDSDTEEEELHNYKVLVLGEVGVGKTAFIQALKEYIGFQKSSFSESVYNPTKTEFLECIPETNAELIMFGSVIENAINKKYNKDVAKFMIRPHSHKKRQFLLMEKKDIGQCNYLQNRDIGKIEIVEIPSTIQTFPTKFADQFDKIIIMGDYHDITTLRSIHYWAELIKAPRSKIIACVNKCDISPISTSDDFQSRKAQILKHYFENYRLEFISVKTGANLAFLYKYL